MATSAKSPVDVPVEPGKVHGVRTQFLLQGDEVLAQRLQDEEYGVLHNWNRAERQVARQDVPLAKVVQTNEEEQRQKEELQRLEVLKKRADEDAQLAHQIVKNEMLKKKEEKVNEEDVRLAKQMQREEIARQQSIESSAKEDALLARQLQKDELLSRRKERIEREAEDMGYARQLQENERRLAELMKEERRLQRQHHRETAQQGEPDTRLQTSRAMRIGSDDSEAGEELLDADAEQQLKQDREMARALQELEIEQKRATSLVDGEDEYDVESGDARLARIMQEQERLDAMMHREQKRIRRAQKQQQREKQQRERIAIEQQLSGAGVRQPPPYDSIPHTYDKPTSPTVSPPPPPGPPPPPPDDRYRRLSPDQAPTSPLSASSATRNAPASNRPERPPPPGERPRDERRLAAKEEPRQQGDRRQRDDAGRPPATGSVYAGPMGRSVSLSEPNSANNGQGVTVPQRRAATSPRDASTGIQQDEASQKNNCKQQ